MKTKYGSKIIVHIPDDIDRAVGPGARDIVNYCGLIMRSTISFRDGEWAKNFAKHGEKMWLKVKVIHYSLYLTFRYLALFMLLGHL